MSCPIAIQMVTSSVQAFRSRSTSTGRPCEVAVCQRLSNLAVSKFRVGKKFRITSGVSPRMTSFLCRFQSSPSELNTPVVSNSLAMRAECAVRRYTSGRSRSMVPINAGSDTINNRRDPKRTLHKGPNSCAQRSRLR